MPNPEHVSLLCRSVSDWNSWRQIIPSTIIDLRNANLKGARLAWADLRKADLRGADLRRMSLHPSKPNNSDFWGIFRKLLRIIQIEDSQKSTRDGRGGSRMPPPYDGFAYSRPQGLANFSGADLSGVNLTNATFVTLQSKVVRRDDLIAKLNGEDLIAIFHNADLRKSDLSGSFLSGINFTGADLSEAILEGANLSRASLVGANLKGVRLKGANLSKAVLSGLDLSGVDLSDLNLSEAIFSEANLKANLKQANLKKANLSEAILNGIDLNGVDLSEVDLRGANLSGVDLRNTNLTNTNLCKANLSGANLSDLDFQGANLSGVDLRNAIISKTKFSKANLSGANLSDVDLSNIDLSGIDLTDANLTNANLSQHDYFGFHVIRSINDANLSKADLRNANLIGIDFNRANFSEVDLRLAKLSKTKFLKSNLNEVKLSDLDLSETDFSSVDLNKADFSGSTLIKANFKSNLNICSAIFDGANLQEAIFDGANLYDAKFRDAILFKTQLCRANLTKANLTGANLTGANLSRACLIESIFDGATLEMSWLWGTQLSGWSIKSVVCEFVSWETDLTELTKYKPHDFERLHSEKTKIFLHYKDGITPLEIVTLPALIQNLETTHSCKLRFKSSEDVSGGARVTIVIDETDDNTIEQLEKLKAKIEKDAKPKQEVLRNALDESQRFLPLAQPENEITVSKGIIPERSSQPQRGLSQVSMEQREIISELIGQVLPLNKMVDKLLIEHITIHIGDNNVSNDTFNISGPVGVAGSNAHDNTFNQIVNQFEKSINLTELAQQLEELRQYANAKPDTSLKGVNSRDNIDLARDGANEKNPTKVVASLKAAGEWALDLAKEAGKEIVVEAIKQSMGIS